MIIDCISDLHGYFPKLEGGDLLIVAGDLTAKDYKDEYIEFARWVCRTTYKKIVVIAGNHDNLMQGQPEFFCSDEKLTYLCDSGTEFEGLKIWGSPWSLKFEGMNLHCMAFTGTDDELKEKYALIPEDTDILITHGPQCGIFDVVEHYNKDHAENVGSCSLGERIVELKNLKLHVCGHIHEAYGNFKGIDGVHYVNASYVNEFYKPVNKPVRIIL